MIAPTTGHPAQSQQRASDHSHKTPPYKAPLTRALAPLQTKHPRYLRLALTDRHAARGPVNTR